MSMRGRGAAAVSVIAGGAGRRGAARVGHSQSYVLGTDQRGDQPPSSSVSHIASKV